MPTSLATWRSERATRLLSSHRASAASRIARRVRSLRSPRVSPGRREVTGPGRSSHRLVHPSTRTVTDAAGERSCTATVRTTSRRWLHLTVLVDRTDPVAEAAHVVGVAVDHHEVGAQSRAQGAPVPGHVEQLGRRPGGRVQASSGRQSRARSSARAPRGWSRAGRRRSRCPWRSGRPASWARRTLSGWASATSRAFSTDDSGSGRPASAAAMHRPRRVQGRHQPGAALEHHLDRLVVEEDAVLDRAHAVAQRRLDAAGALGVGHHVQSRPRSPRRSSRRSRRRGSAACRGSSRGESTPPVVATLITSAPARMISRTRCAHLVGAVHDAAGPPRVRHQERHVGPADAPVVAVAAGLAEHDHRDLHPRAGDHPALDRLLDAQVGPAGVADAGDARVQRLAAGSRPLRRTAG